MSAATSSDFSAAGNYGMTSVANVTGATDGPHGYMSSAKTNEPTTERTQRPRSGRAAKPLQSSIEDRHAVADNLKEALENARNLEAAVLSVDPREAAIAGLNLRENLRQLWRLRHVRSDDWATITNKLQVVTSQVEFEQFTADMANAVRMVIESHLGPDADNEDIRAATVLLERNGLDPWKSFVNDDNDS